MIKLEKNLPNQRPPRDQRNRELLLGNIVTWGTIAATVVLAIVLIPAQAFNTGDMRIEAMDEEQQLVEDEHHVSSRQGARFRSLNL